MTTEAVIEESTQKNVHKMVSQLATFMALYEDADNQFKKQKEELEQLITQFKQEVKDQVHSINEAVGEAKEVMDATGAARWRIAAEKSMKAGEGHLTALKEATNVYKKLAEDSVTRLEHISLATEKRVNNALNQLKDDNLDVVDDFRQHAEQAYLSLEKTSVNSINYLKKMLRWFRFDRIVIAVIAGLLSAFLTSAYVNAEWPWETHIHTTQQRFIGKTVLAVWPTLSKAKQADLNQLLGINIQ